MSNDTKATCTIDASIMNTVVEYLSRSRQQTLINAINKSIKVNTVQLSETDKFLMEWKDLVRRFDPVENNIPIGISYSGSGEQLLLNYSLGQPQVCRDPAELQVVVRDHFIEMLTRPPRK